MENVATDTVVLIYGLWMTPLAWEYWVQRYEKRGFRVITPGYPGVEQGVGGVEALRRDPSPLEDLGVREVFDFDRLYGLLATADKENNRDVIRRFPVRRGNEFTFVQVGDVDWIEGLGDYAGLHVGDRTHLVREPLTLLEARLNPTQFVRFTAPPLCR